MPVALRIWDDLSKEAQLWPVTMLDEQGNTELCNTHEGAAVVLWVSLRRHQPGFTIERARELAAEVSDEELNQLIRYGFHLDEYRPPNLQASSMMMGMMSSSPRESDDAA